jgi:hypothetical protein
MLRSSSTRYDYLTQKAGSLLTLLLFPQGFESHYSPITHAHKTEKASGGSSPLDRFPPLLYPDNVITEIIEQDVAFSQDIISLFG